MNPTGARHTLPNEGEPAHMTVVNEPLIEITTLSADRGTVDGQAVARNTYGSIHQACIAELGRRAADTGNSVLAHAVDTINERAEFWIRVQPDGTVTNAEPPRPPAAATPPTAAAPSTPPTPLQVPSPAPTNGSPAADPPVPVRGQASAPMHVPPAQPAGAVHTQAPVTSQPPRDHAFAPSAVGGSSNGAGQPQQLVPSEPPASVPTLSDLLSGRPDPQPGPAELGWQAAVRRATFGLITIAPGKAEMAHRQAVAAVQRSLNGPKTIAIINPKGGADKTTASLLIAATFGIHRGGYTIAWDNNETRGTMGWRAIPARHTNTAVDLHRELYRFEDPSLSRVGDLDNFVRGQGSAQFDVLASDEDADSAASIDAAKFNALHATLSRFYRVIVVDTGNNMRASNWQAAVQKADQLVIVSTIREDTSQSAAWVADALRSQGMEDKVRHAVTVIAAPGPKPDMELDRRLTDHFTNLTRAVAHVPFDSALVAGGPIQIDALSSASREAWLHVTALVADGL